MPMPRFPNRRSTTCFTSQTYNHAVTYNHASADGNLQKKCLRFNIILKLKIIAPKKKLLAVNETKF